MLPVIITSGNGVVYQGFPSPLYGTWAQPWSKGYPYHHYHIHHPVTSVYSPFMLKNTPFYLAKPYFYLPKNRQYGF